MAQGKIRNIFKNIFSGKIKVAEFSITNACIAKCSFCEIWKQQPKIFVDKQKALNTIDRLADHGTVQLTITGGEPLLHPNIIDFIKRATERKMHNAVLNAAPQLLLRNDIIKRLEDAGNDIISISFDTGDPKIMAESRQIPNIMDDMARAMEEISKTKILTMASILIWNNNYDNLEEVCKSAHSLGFNIISINYPTFSQSKVYPLGGEGISLSRENVIHALESVIKLRKIKKYGIINTAASIRNIINFLKDPKLVKYHCQGGSKVLFVDWFYDVHPCMQLPHTLGNILTMEERDFKMLPCNECNMSWYRDFSAMFQGIKSIPVWFESLGNLNKISSVKRST